MGDVSRETLAHYITLVSKWSQRIQLVSRGDLDRLEERHVIDSLAIEPFFPERSIDWLDLGSGGGFPAMPLLISRRGHGFEDRLTMVEADVRKAAFLRAALRVLGLGGRVIAERIEDMATLDVDLITARALAPLEQLLGMAAPHLAPDGRFIAMKGRQAEREIDAARRIWSFECEANPSPVGDGTTLVIHSIARKAGS